MCIKGLQQQSATEMPKTVDTMQGKTAFKFQWGYHIFFVPVVQLDPLREEKPDTMSTLTDLQLISSFMNDVIVYFGTLPLG